MGTIQPIKIKDNRQSAQLKWNEETQEQDE
jgi:hypothetical protein